MVYYGKLWERTSENDEFKRHNQNSRTYMLQIDEKYVDCEFSEDEKLKLRPIAEVIGMLEGNYSIEDSEFYLLYLPEAATIFYLHENTEHLSWIKDAVHETQAVKDAWKSWQTLKKLSQDE